MSSARVALRASLLCTALGAVACSGGANLADGPTLADPNDIAFAGQPFDRGVLQFRAGHYGLALESFREALTNDRLSVRNLNAVAATYDQLGRFDLSAKYYLQALERDSESVQTLNNIGYSFLLQQRPDRAVRYFAAARHLAPSNQVVHINGAIAENMLGIAHRRENEIVVARAEAPSTPEAPKPSAWVERSGEASYALVTQAEPADVSRIEKSGTRPAVAMVSVKPTAADRSIEQQVLPPEPAKPADAAHAAVRHETDTPESEIEPRDPAAFSEALVFVANGAGRRHMASRMRSHLSTKGLTVDGLVNAEHFDHTNSVILYKPGFLNQAKYLAEFLPIKVELREVADGRADVSLLLGGDLLDFDKTLLGQFGKATS